jgi:WD40 repeat protein
MRFGKTVVAMATSVAAGVAFAVLPVTSAAADSSLTIPRIVVDGQNQHIYISAGEQISFVEVFDLDGNRVGSIDDQDSATGMVLSPDGSTLYIAHSELGTISAVSTATLQQTAVYQTGVDTEHLAFAGGRLWFGYRTPDCCGGYTTGMGSVDVGGSAPTVSLEPQWPWYAAAPNVLADPADPDKLIVASDGYSGVVGVFDVSSGTAVQTALNEEIDTFYCAAVTPDGKDVAVASLGDHSVQFYRTSDLMPDGAPYPLNDAAMAVAIAPDGTVAAGSWYYWSVPSVGVSVFGPGESTPRRTYTPPVDEGGLAWSPDGSRLYAVSGGSSGLGDTSPVLNVFENPAQGDNTMTLNPPPTVESGVPYTVGGKMTSSAPFAAGQTVHVTRVDTADPDGLALPDAAVNADGTFSFTDTATAEGDVTYQVAYYGDRDHRSAQQSASLSVTKAAKADTTLWLQFEDRARVGRKLKMDGRLTSALAIPVGATVTITREDDTGPGDPEGRRRWHIPDRRRPHGGWPGRLHRHLCGGRRVQREHGVGHHPGGPVAAGRRRGNGASDEGPPGQHRAGRYHREAEHRMWAGSQPST